MAALLKKRALAEYSQTQVILQEQPPPKKLRLVKKLATGSSAAAYIGLLENSKTSNDASKVLLRIAESDSLQFEEGELAEMVKKLSELYQHCSESVPRGHILSLLVKVGGEEGADVAAILEEAISLLSKEEAHGVRAQGMAALLSLGRLVPDNSPARQRLVNVAKQYLSDTSHLCKCKCLALIGGLASGEAADHPATLRLVTDHAHSEDARVRSAALGTLSRLHARGATLDPAVYPVACLALRDDYEIVRRVALQLIWVLGQTYPDNEIQLSDSSGVGGGETVRLVDDAFGKLCNSVNDLSMHVRTFAARLLGSVTLVSSRFLEQTLSKSIMSNMRKKRTAHERAWESVTSGEWSSGKKWADDAPREVVDGETFELLSSGACGAFVHGLEDEYQEVRSASVDSLCQLSLRHPSFARSSVDFLVDMFNDEIEEVRLKAIDSLTRISRYTVLREDQLETILGALKDFSLDVREGLHGMLAACRLSTKGCLQMCVESLLDNLKKYPMDRKSTWRCLQQMGQYHPELTLPLVPTLLSIHPFFELAEPDVDDPAYVCVLILVLNAAQHCPSMTALLEEHTIKHYAYLRDTMPHLVPVLKLGTRSGGMRDPTQLTPVAVETGAVETGTEETERVETGAEFLSSLLDKIEQSRSPLVRVELLTCAERDLTRLAAIDPHVGGAARFSALYVGAQLLLARVLADRLWADPQALANQHGGGVVRHAVAQLLQHCLKLQHLFTGLSEQDRAAVKQLRLKALALQLVYTVRGSNSSALALCQHFLEQVEDTQSYLSQHLLQPDVFTLSVLRDLSLLSESRPGAVARCLLPLLALPAPTPRPAPSVAMTAASLSEPSGETDVALKFTAGLVLGVPLVAEICNLAHPHLLRIKIKYPDQQTRLVVPTRSHLRPLLRRPDPPTPDSPDTDYRLSTTVLFSHQVWTEACTVDLSLALDLSGVGGRRGGAGGASSVVDLCPPVKVLIAPKQVRRGI